MVQCFFPFFFQKLYLTVFYGKQMSVRSIAAFPVLSKELIGYQVFWLSSAGEKHMQIHQLDQTKPAW